MLSAYSHATPFGPLGSACFFLAALWIELVWRKVPRIENDARVVSPASHKGGEILVMNPRINDGGLSLAFDRQI
jgi:hypothetical protein